MIMYHWFDNKGIEHRQWAKYLCLGDILSMALSYNVNSIYINL